MELPLVPEFTFKRSSCSCRLCQVPCKLLPGYLIPSDLQRLPSGDNLLDWAKVHLRASPGFVIINRSLQVRLGTLVPARVKDDACHWFVDGRCQVHQVAPFGCAYFSEHMTDSDDKERRDAGYQAVRKDWEEQGPYSRLWKEMESLGLTGPEIIGFKRRFAETIEDMKRPWWVRKMLEKKRKKARK